MWISTREESTKAALSWQCNEKRESVRRATEGHFGFVLHAGSPGYEPGFIPVLLLSIWMLVTVVLEVPQ